MTLPDSAEQSSSCGDTRGKEKTSPINGFHSCMIGTGTAVIKAKKRFHSDSQRVAIG